MTLRIALIGDGESPHLLKWARALDPLVDLYVVSSRGFAAGFDDFLPPARRMALQAATRFEGGNAHLLLRLPAMSAWLRKVQPDWLAPHYLTSHGTLAWLAVRLFRVRARIAGSAWGSDILVAPRSSRLLRWLTRRVLAACDLATSDSQFMAQRMLALGAGEIMTFPFGLESLPPPAVDKDDALFFANRALEPIYAPRRVLEVFASLARDWPQARLIVANDGSRLAALRERAQAPDLAGRVEFVGRLGAAAQERMYAQARWFISMPRSDSVSVSVLEAMGHGAIPILSDLPANRELVADGDNGLILADGELPARARLLALARRAEAIASSNRAWIAANALFPVSVRAYVARLEFLNQQP